MQTTIHINLCGRIVQVTDDAWKKHLTYIETLRNYFIAEQSGFEIINDIESRIAELMLEKMNRECAFVNEQDMENIIGRIGTVSDFSELDNVDTEIPQSTFKLAYQEELN